MTAKDEEPDGAPPNPVSLSGVVLFSGIWAGLLWLMILVLAVHAYRVGEATPFRYVGF